MSAGVKPEYITNWRSKIVHKRCDTLLRLHPNIADVLSRHPGFFAGLHCVECGRVFRAKEFYWADDPTETLDGEST